jgi:hypothetical protein
MNYEVTRLSAARTRATSERVSIGLVRLSWAPRSKAFSSLSPWCAVSRMTGSLAVRICAPSSSNHVQPVESGHVDVENEQVDSAPVDR